MFATQIRHFAMVIFLLIAVFLVGGATFAQDATPASELEPGTFRNPLNPFNGPDPWLTYYEGNYYLTATTGASHWTMRQSPTLAGLKTAQAVVIYQETEPSRCCNFWAPEFHMIDGPNGPRWYFYYSAGTSGTLDNQHTHVLESEGTDPMGPYTYKARIYDETRDMWAIDGSILEHEETLYFLYSIWEGDYQTLVIAPMSDPWTLSGPGTTISRSQYDWEMSGANVNEGPVALYHEDDTFIVYSASYCVTADYKLGLLELVGDDPMDPESWYKHPEPVFERSDENDVYGPGHNGFFMSPDGTEYWIVYHANSSPSYGCDDNRTTRAQPFTWNEDGTPNFGEPVSTDEVIAAPSGDIGIDPLPDINDLPAVRLASVAFNGAYMTHNNTFVEVTFGADDVPNSLFRIVPGLADEEAVSIESVNMAGFYLSHQNNAVVLSANDGSEDAAANATWRMQPGFAAEDGISFESYNRSGYFIGRMMGVIALAEITENATEAQLEDATYLIEDATP